MTLKYDNGEGLTFRRTIAVDERYLFTDQGRRHQRRQRAGHALSVRADLAPRRAGGRGLLHPARRPDRLSRRPGPAGIRLQPKIDDGQGGRASSVTNGWLGITDKYWASALLPDTTAQLQARFSSNRSAPSARYQTDYLHDPQTIAIGGTGSANARLFAGAKEAGVVGINFPFAGLGGYNKQLGLNHFDLLIDWGWFYFITKPMFLALDFFYHLVGNFGVAILLVTVLVKLLFFPLANKSYASMAKMKAVQPQLAALKERYPDDKAEAAAGDDGDLPQGEDQPDRRLSSGRAADPGVLLALQGAVRHHRNAARAVLRLDQGSLGARPDHDLQPVRAAAVRSDACAGARRTIWRSASGRSSWASRCGCR